MKQRSMENLAATWQNTLALHPEQRQGQAAMNALRIIDRELYEQITGTPDDPLYDDSRMAAFLSLVSMTWGA